MPRKVLQAGDTTMERLNTLISHMHDGYLLLEEVRLRNPDLFVRLGRDGGFIEQYYTAHDAAIQVEQQVKNGTFFEDATGFDFDHPGPSQYDEDGTPISSFRTFGA